MVKSTFAKSLSIFPESEKLKGIILIFATLITSALEALGISLILPILTLTIDGNLSRYNFNLEGFLNNFVFFGNISLINKIFFILIFIYVIKNIYLIIYYFFQNKYSLNIYKIISTKLYKLYLHSNMSFHFDRNSAVLIRNVLVECKNYSSVINTFIKLISEVAIFFSITVALFILRPFETSVSILLVGFSILILHFITSKRVENWGKIRQDTTGFSLKNLQQGLQAIKDVKLKNCETIFVSKYQYQINEFVKSAYKHNTISELPKIWLELVFIIFLPLILIITPNSLMSNNLDFKEILPTLGLFVAAIFKLMPSVYRIFSSYQSIVFNKAAIEKLYNEFNSIDFKIKNNYERPLRNFSFKNEIELDNVTFKYVSSDKNLLQNFSLKIKKNEIVGLIGTSGVGKSSLIDLITGLIEPNKGVVKVDEINIKNNLKGWHNIIGYLPASCYLLDDTIKNNIAFGIEENDINLDRVVRCAKDAQIYDYIVNLKDKFETMIGERGVKLSDGQRQRIGIARELYRNNEVLIFDEATSTLDINTENEILSTLDNLKKSKTIIIVSHRENTIKICDRVINLYVKPYLNYNETKK